VGTRLLTLVLNGDVERGAEASNLAVLDGESLTTLAMRRSRNRDEAASIATLSGLLPGFGACPDQLGDAIDAFGHDVYSWTVSVRSAILTDRWLPIRRQNVDAREGNHRMDGPSRCPARWADDSHSRCIPTQCLEAVLRMNRWFGAAPLDLAEVRH
jgi:hypothetical protein